MQPHDQRAATAVDIMQDMVTDAASPADDSGRVAWLRRPAEEDSKFGKDRFGLDHSQVRLPSPAPATSC
jgi:hypothetical protein